MRLPTTIGHMTFALLTFLVAVAVNALGWVDLSATTAFMQSIDFSEALLRGIVSFPL